MGRSCWLPIVALVAASLFAAVAVAVAGGQGPLAAAVSWLDDRVPHTAAGWRTPPLTALMLAVTAAGGGTGIVLSSVAGGAWLARLRRWRAAALLWIGTGGAALLLSAAKMAFGRPRPDWPELTAAAPVVGPSFPSGHACLSLVVYGWLFLLLRPRRTAAAAWIGAALALLLAAIGFSRIYLGVHYPSDVLAGWLAGLTLLCLLMSLHRRYDPGRSSEPMRGTGRSRTMEAGDTK